MAGIGSTSDSSGGYDYHFVKTPSEFLFCAICHFPSREPHLTECCGHTFCKSCLEASKKMNDACPMCRSENFVSIFNKQVDRLVRSLDAFCTNKGQGCDWQGEVKNVTDHLSKCLFQVVCCSNDCGKSLERQYLTSHVETECPRRKIECQFCHDIGEYRFIEGQHKEECSKFPLLCPNKCEIESIKRDKIEEHRKICPLEVIQCDYHVIGCTVRMARKELSKHKQEMMEEHLSLSINELIVTKAQLKSTATEQQLSALQLEVRKTQDELNEVSKQQAAVHQDALAATQGHLTQQLLHINKDLTTIKEQLKADQSDATKTKNELLQKHATTERDLKNVKKSIQSLTKDEKELAGSTEKSLAEMKSKESELSKRADELESKLDEVEGMFYDPTIFWYNTLNYRASKLSSRDQVVPVVVKMPEFTTNKQGWSSPPFYLMAKPSQQSQKYKSLYMHNMNVFQAYPVQLKVTTTEDNHISVFLLMPGQSSASSHRSELNVVVKLLNQISDGEHCTITDKSPAAVSHEKL